jgi:hypothetical protein
VVLDLRRYADLHDSSSPRYRVACPIDSMIVS